MPTGGAEQISSPVAGTLRPSVDGQGFQEGDQKTLTFTLGGQIQRREGNQGGENI